MAWRDIEEKPLSATQIGMYLRCPKQYEFRYVRGMRRPPTLSMVVGTGVHAGAQVNFASKLKKGRPAKLSDTLDAFSTKFEAERRGAEKDEDPRKAKDRGVLLTREHYALLAPRLQPVEAPELSFSVEVPGVRRKMVGFIDIIAHPVSRLGKVLPTRHVRDLKTSGRRYAKLEVELSGQLTAYAFAHKSLFKVLPDHVGLDILVSPKNSTEVGLQCETSERTKSELDRWIKTVQMVERGIDAGVFPAVDNAKVCSWCGYRDICANSAFRRCATSF
jgi:putative RecB family exonuclease